MEAVPKRELSLARRRERTLVAIWRASKGAKAGWLGLGPIGEATFFPFQLTHASREKLLLENKQQQEG